MAKDNTIVLGGEVTTSADLSMETLENIVSTTLDRIGYNYEPTIINLLNKQSSDIALGVDIGGAGDQGIMFGYACNDTEDYMPMSYSLARYIIRMIEKEPSLMELGPDMKSQVSYNYETKKVEKILVSVQHPENMTQQDVYLKLYSVIESSLSRYGVEPADKLENILMVNPTGRFVIGGPEGDCGITGRKIVVDGYGSIAHVGGGCFSSKNATKVDRSGAYYARYVAKSLVANGLCDRCEIGVSYAIGLENAMSINIDCFSTNKVDMKEIYDIVKKNFDFSVQNIIDELDLNKPIYKKTSCFGHFSSPEFSWEKIKKLK